jgi:tetratricopeptide (TPR) repeat protein
MRSGKWRYAARLLVIALFCYAAETARAQPAGAASGYLDRGVEFARDGKFPEAAAEFLRAIALDPKLAEAHYLLGLVRQSWGKWADAGESYRQALRLNPRYAEAQLGLAAVLTRQADDDASREAAAGACRKAIELNPKEAEPHFHLGVLEQQGGRYEAAATSFEKVIQLNPAFPGGRLALAQVWVELRQMERAIPLLHAIIQQAPKEALAHHLLGAALAKQGDATGAVKSLGTAAQLDPINAQTRYMLAANLRKLGRIDESAAEMRRFQELTAGREDRMQARHHLSLAQNLLADRKVQEAIGEFQESLSYRRDASVATDLGVALLTANRVDEAIEILREVVGGSPQQVLAHYHLGLARARKGEYAAARAEFTAALRLRPDFPEALFGMGMAFVEEGDLKEAEKNLRDSIRLRPDLAAPHYHLGVILKQRGEVAEAESEFAAARQIDPNFQLVRQQRQP